MKFQEVIQNKWVKRAGIVGILALIGFGVKAAVSSNSAADEFDENKSGNDEINADDYSITETTDTVNKVVAPVIPGMKIYQFVAYSPNSIAVGKKRYTFASSAVKKIQTYFSKNKVAKEQIDKSGGIDGSIGETFAKILFGILKNVPSTGREAAMKSIMTNAGLKQTEATIKSI